MKKLLTVFLGLAFLVGTVGCPKKDPVKPKTDPVKTVEPEKKAETK